MIFPANWYVIFGSVKWNINTRIFDTILCVKLFSLTVAVVIVVFFVVIKIQTIGANNFKNLQFSTANQNKNLNFETTCDDSIECSLLRKESLKFIYLSIYLRNVSLCNPIYLIILVLYSKCFLLIILFFYFVLFLCSIYLETNCLAIDFLRNSKPIHFTHTHTYKQLLLLLRAHSSSSNNIIIIITIKLLLFVCFFFFILHFFTCTNIHTFINVFFLMLQQI